MSREALSRVSFVYAAAEEGGVCHFPEVARTVERAARAPGTPPFSVGVVPKPLQQPPGARGRGPGPGALRVSLTWQRPASTRAKCQSLDEGWRS